MFPIGIPQYDLNDLKFFDKNICGDFNFDNFNYLEPSNVAGQNQTYTGVEVMGDLYNYPRCHSPSPAPVSLDPRIRSYPNAGKSCRTFQRLSFKDSLSDRRILLPIRLPGCTGVLLFPSNLLPSNGPSLPDLFIFILSLPLACSNSLARL
jgi:hypothetical protein